MKNLLEKVLPSEIAQSFGFTPEAEILNGRLAMLGFVIGILTEVLVHKGILQQVGLG